MRSKPDRSSSFAFLFSMLALAGCGGADAASTDVTDATATETATDADRTDSASTRDATDSAVTHDATDSTVPRDATDSEVDSSPLDADAGGSSDTIAADGTPTDAGGSDTPTTIDSAPAPDTATIDAGTDAAPVASKIEHVVLIVQENHTFDAYFGRYCTAATGSSPTCNDGPGCCEAAPTTEPGGDSATSLTDSENAAYDPNHTQACEVAEIDGGAMDHYTSGSGVSGCSDARNFAVAPSTTMKLYHGYAAGYAIADRYFQPIAGQSSSNDMYFARAQYVFTDNAYEPPSYGSACSIVRTTKSFSETTIADLLIAAGKTFAVYAEGYAAMKSAQTAFIPYCPLPPSSCTMTPIALPTSPCDYDPGDVPFEYFASLRDDPAHMKDVADLATDLAGTLPSFSFVKAVGYENEHPGYGTTISNGTSFVDGIVKSIQSSKYAANTLILITWDEGGGFYDHVAPPAASAVDGQPYGTRVPLLVVGPFAKKNFVSHVVMEHSSIVKFLELNFLGSTGQLAGRDAVVNDIGSLLDPTTTGIVVP